MLAFAAAQYLEVRERAGPGCPDRVAGGVGLFGLRMMRPCPAVAGVPSTAHLRGAGGGIEPARPGQHYNRHVSRKNLVVFGGRAAGSWWCWRAGWFAPADWPARQHHTSLRKPLLVPTSQGTGETLFGDPLGAMVFRVWIFVVWFVRPSFT